MSDRRFRSPYPDYDVLAKWDSRSWNDLTREVVARRLDDIPARAFFEEAEWELLEAACDRIVPQGDRREGKIPIVPWIDQRLSRGEGEGYRYSDMPTADVAWRRGLRGIDREGRRLFGRRFVDLPGEQQDKVLHAIQTGNIDPANWEGIPVGRFFIELLLKEAVGAYYAHPAAWSEIGFGGPASPRGYVRLGMDESDPWEAKEVPPGGPSG